ncbi:MAG: EamA family transporter [Acidobacteria bacterium]|jgi:drug/metabolite transporter (DMT)-like permease|nr:EamA family transporter [Acidobacteriota bacterium]
MALLLITSFIWAFSFGLVKDHLGGVDAAFVAFARLALALLLFLPLLRPRRVARGLTLRLLAVGAIQFGLMYVFYIQSFRYLAAYQVALFTIFTPLLVAAADDVLENRFRPAHFWTALLAVAGAAVIVYSGMGMGGILAGFALVQASNACFALGQVMYRRLARRKREWRDRDAFAWLYLGGAAAAALAMFLVTGSQVPRLDRAQALVLLYLGLLASGVGFFLWNVGASRVTPGVLAVFNNVKIPLAVIVSLVFFNERADLLRLALGGSAILLALYLNTSKNEIISGSGSDSVETSK